MFPLPKIVLVAPERLEQSMKALQGRESDGLIFQTRLYHLLTSCVTVDQLLRLHGSVKWDNSYFERL